MTLQLNLQVDFGDFFASVKAAETMKLLDPRDKLIGTLGLDLQVATAAVSQAMSTTGVSQPRVAIAARCRRLTTRVASITVAIAATNGRVASITVAIASYSIRGSLSRSERQ